jgi:hypothetical protein
MWSSTTPSAPGQYWFKGSFEPIDDVLANLLNVVTIDKEQVIVPGVAGTIPLGRFIGEWHGPLEPPA